MKEISDYQNYVATISADFPARYNAEGLRLAIEPLVNTLDDTTLRELIQHTRTIREVIFRQIDTHILTIEHLADKELCQRRARERAAKDSTKEPRLNTVLSGQPRAFAKVPVKSKMEQLLELMNKATPEQLEEALRNAKK